jgi:hypothetical protein
MQLRLNHSYLSWAPLIWVAVFLSFVLRAWLALGRLPYPYNPDPKDLGFELHMTLVHFGFLATIGITVLFFVLWLLDGKRCGKFDRSSLTVQLFGMTVLGWIVFFDPGKFLEWFMD